MSNQDLWYALCTWGAGVALAIMIASNLWFGDTE